MHTEDILRIRDKDSVAESISNENKIGVLFKQAQMLLVKVTTFNNEKSIHKLEQIIKYIKRIK
jgi:hypothetical protein